MRVLLQLLHLPLPVTELHFNFVNSTRPALMMESERYTSSHLFYSFDKVNYLLFIRKMMNEKLSMHKDTS